MAVCFTLSQPTNFLSELRMCLLQGGRTPGGSDLKNRSTALAKTYPHSETFLIYRPDVAVSLSSADCSGLEFDPM